jgi:putative endopeptidase
MAPLEGEFRLFCLARRGSDPFTHIVAKQSDPPTCSYLALWESIMTRFWFVLFVLSCASGSAWTQSLSSGVDADTFDKTVRIQDDFYRAVNGTWLRETEIPADKSNYGSFTVLADLSEKRIKSIIDTAASNENEPGSNSQKVGDLFGSFMDVERINALGIQPIEEEMARVNAIQNYDDVVKYFGYAQVRGIGTPIGMFIDQDDKDSSNYIVQFIQSGTSLPDRDYYLKDDEKYKLAQEALKSYITKLFALYGIDAPGAAEQIYEIESNLARNQWERTELRDADKRYNKYSFSQLAELTPDFDWNAFFAQARLSDRGDVLVLTPSFFEGLDEMFRNIPVDTWKRYLQFNLIDAAAPYLAEDFAKSHFEFHKQALAGVPQQKPRWKRGVDVVEMALGEVVGELYVQQYFSAEAKARMEELVANLIKAFDNSIDDLDWMTEETKKKAKEKLSRFNVKIGYPDEWKDYSKLVIESDDLIGNLKRSLAVEYQREVDKLGRPIDRNEWGMTPQTVNAYYNPSMNEIVFPAAILQPPFFNMESDDAVNYGGIGAVIGHEISHGFDDQGSKYDGDGNLNSWWNAKDRQAFEALTARLVDQFNEYSPLPGKTVNGQLTLGENIADLSGLSIAHKAYRISLGGSEPPTIDGWTGNQRFFLGWSQVWRRKYRDAEMMRRLLTDPHAPSWYRANGPIINIDAFYEAFNVQPDDQLYRPAKERIKIW